MSNPFYTRAFNLTDHVDYLTALTVKNEFALVEAGFDKLPVLTGNAGKLISVKADETGYEAVAVGVPASSLLTSGYYVLDASPDDLILQWATGTSNSTGDVTITLPTTFPTALLHALICASDSGGWVSNELFAWSIDFSACTTSSIVADVRKLAGTASPTNAANGKVCRVLAWGY